MIPPEFDALYLDMNGIIHVSTHGDSPTEELPEDVVFLKIFQYIDKLFHMVKPCKYFFMAIDGVAPRAKLNQQRQRRFRSAKEAEEALARAAKNDEHLEKPFDSNCITPGTEFMARLSEQLHNFIYKKMEEDAMWRRVKVIFSGHEVPGEGEHKIMDFIRRMKAQPEWDPNMRHCLYGLDADLIMLSLTTHEPHFSLLREEVLTKTSKRDSGSTTFQLLHLSLLRQYLQLEFDSLFEANGASSLSSIKTPWELERIIDDFVLMCFFIGNDFLPNLPGIDIAEGSLNKMFDLYKELLPKMKVPYLTNGTSINFENLELYLHELGKNDRYMFEIVSVDIPELRHSKGVERPNSSQKLDTSTDSDLHAPDDLHISVDDKLARELKQIGIDVKKEKEEMKQLELEADESWKDMYYKDKFKFEFSDAGNLRKLCQSYLEGVLWVLNYYHKGCISWGWYFPYHYAPLACDLKNLKSYKFEFELGKPFFPYQQLLSVLPTYSASLVPEAFRWLMTKAESPIHHFYPHDFKVDLNGKKNDWEAIVLIPFIEEQLLVKAYNLVDQKKLSDYELKRNAFGDAYSFEFSETNPVQVVHSSLKSIGAIKHQAKKNVLNLPDFPEPNKIGFWKCAGAKDIPGFPSFLSMEFSHKFRSSVIKLFGGNSRRESLIFEVKPNLEEDVLFLKQFNSEELPLKNKEYINGVLQKCTQLIQNQVCYVHWPTCREARFMAITVMLGNISAAVKNEKLFDSVVGFKVQKKGRFPLEPEEMGSLEKEMKYFQSVLLSRKGMEVGNVQCVAHVQLLKSIQEIKGKREKTYFDDELRIPLKLVLKDMPSSYDKRYFEELSASATAKYQPGSKVINVARNAGSVGEIVTEKNGKFLVDFELLDDIPTFGREVFQEFKPHFYTAADISRQLGISARTVARITSSVIFQPGNINMGLNLKLSKKQTMTLGYVKGRLREPFGQQQQQKPEGKQMSQIAWEYSEATVKILEDYLDQYPGIFDLLEDQPDNSFYRTEDLLDYCEEEEDGASKETKTVPKDVKDIDFVDDELYLPSNLLSVPAPHVSVQSSAKSPAPVVPNRERSNSRGPKGEDDVDLDDLGDLDDADIEQEIVKRLPSKGQRILQIVKKLKNFLKGLPCNYLPKVPLGSMTLTNEGIQKVEAAATKYFENANLKHRKDWVETQHFIGPNSLVVKSLQYSAENANHNFLGDRILVISGTAPVPFGSSGTIVATRGNFVDIVLDRTFLGANDLFKRCSMLRGISLTLDSVMNVTDLTRTTASYSPKAPRGEDSQQNWRKNSSSNFVPNQRQSREDSGPNNNNSNPNTSPQKSRGPQEGNRSSAAPKKRQEEWKVRSQENIPTKSIAPPGSLPSAPAQSATNVAPTTPAPSNFPQGKLVIPNPLLVDDAYKRQNPLTKAESDYDPSSFWNQLQPKQSAPEPKPVPAPAAPAVVTTTTSSTTNVPNPVQAQQELNWQQLELLKKFGGNQHGGNRGGHHGGHKPPRKHNVKEPQTGDQQPQATNSNEQQSSSAPKAPRPHKKYIAKSS